MLDAVRSVPLASAPAIRVWLMVKVVSYLFACASGNGGIAPATPLEIFTDYDSGVQCRSSEEGTGLTLISLQYSTAVDILTDVLSRGPIYLLTFSILVLANQMGEF